MNIPSGELGVTLSLGVLADIQRAAASSQQLIQAADAALYRAKAGGRDRVELSTLLP